MAVDLSLDNHLLWAIVGVVDEMARVADMLTVPGTVVVRWRETNRWREVELRPEWEPKDRQERVADVARRMVWTGAPLVEAYERAAHIVG